MNTLRRAMLRVILTACLFGGSCVTAVEPLGPQHVRVGLLRESLAGLVENDAKAAVTVLARSVAARSGYDVTLNVEFFDDHAALRSAIARGEVQILLVGLWDYCALGLTKDIEIVYSTIIDGQPATSWLLLTREDGPIRSLSDLRGKHVIIEHSFNRDLGRHWLAARLNQIDANLALESFAHISRVAKPSAATLPVFFGKADACLVDEAAFATICALNPQVGRRLRSIERSTPLPYPVICASRRGWATPGFRQDSLGQFATLGETPEGRQLLTIFKIDRLVRFDPTLAAVVQALFDPLASVRSAPTP